jgi:hypothetical protein
MLLYRTPGADISGSRHQANLEHCAFYKPPAFPALSRIKPIVYTDIHVHPCNGIYEASFLSIYPISLYIND